MKIQEATSGRFVRLEVHTYSLQQIYNSKPRLKTMNEQFLEVSHFLIPFHPSLNLSSIMQSSSSNIDSTVPPPRSDQMVSVTLQKGFEKMIVQTTAGVLLGGIAGLVLARRGGSAAARKGLAGLGAGIGLGSAWTRTSMDLEEMLSDKSAK